MTMAKLNSVTSIILLGLLVILLAGFKQSSNALGFNISYKTGWFNEQRVS